MIDLHCHLLHGLDDGPRSLEESLEMARLMVADGIGVAACTPHIMPGVFNNDGPTIRERVARLQEELDRAGVPLTLVAGADVHMAPNLTGALRSGAALTIHDSGYVLIEPPHHVPPPRIDEAFFDLMAAGYQPILTHPERLTWIERKYDAIERLFAAGVWMQVTAGSLLGDFGPAPKHWAERILDAGMCHILATDAHNPTRRPPRLRAGFEAAKARVGLDEAINLVVHRPFGILENRGVSAMPPPVGAVVTEAERKPRDFWRRVLKMPGRER